MRRACSWPGCPSIVDRQHRYCSRHAGRGTRAEVERVRLYDRYVRSPAIVAFYHSREWLAMRLIVLFEQPVCAICKARFSHHVDHIRSVREHWELRLERTNLQGLCQPCHNAETAKERTGERRPPEIDSGASNGGAAEFPR